MSMLTSKNKVFKETRILQIDLSFPECCNDFCPRSIITIAEPLENPLITSDLEPAEGN
jgi:hypothetical protein